MTWVGRSIRRLEDPVLITGQGRFTADSLAAHWVRFVRSPVAAGRLAKIGPPEGAMVITAADLKDVKKITPMLHKFSYKPVGQPVLAEGVVRFVGEPVAAVVAASEEDAEDIADQVDVSIDETRPVTDARDCFSQRQGITTRSCSIACCRTWTVSQCSALCVRLGSRRRR